jgi:cation:H+ antiporter
LTFYPDANKVTKAGLKRYTLVWLKLVVCILIIFFSGQKVAKYGDTIAERSGIGQVWMGLIAVSLITSLPELFTGISAVTLVDAPDLAVGDLIGANAFNMLNLALLDIAHRHGPFLAAASPTHQLTGWFSLLLILVVAISLLVSAHFHPMSIGWIGWYTPVIIILYLLSVRQIFRYEKRQNVTQETGMHREEESSRKVYLYFVISAAFIIGSGIWLADIGDEIALVTGWGQSFVGSLFLAFTTTLPEITVSFSAMRMGAIDLSVANMIGSNLFNLTIIPVTDLIYVKGPILAGVSESHQITAIAVIVMTLLFIAGLRFRPNRFFRLSWWNLAMIVLFLASAYFSFITA